MEGAIEILLAERDRRRERSAREIADSIIEALTAVERGSAGVDGDIDNKREQLGDKLRRRIAKREREAFARVQNLYRHDELEREEDVAEILDTDLFTTDNWEVFGLSRNQLAMTGALSGAAAGGGVDLALGGTSLLLGAGIGAAIGGASGWWATGELARVKTIVGPLGGRVVQVGPVTAKNFPWVLLGRAWLHHGLIAERNHAHREAVVVSVSNDTHLMNAVPGEIRKSLAAVFQRLSRGNADEDTRARLVQLIEQLLAIPAGSDGP
ncbi:MAG: DUF3482 domain-containing protein [Gammaproteobacteria bacterium]|nr:DUF3482 domain-containing protein [Gammaproteobacteria bacterium]